MVGNAHRPRRHVDRQFVVLARVARIDHAGEIKVRRVDFLAAECRLPLGFELGDPLVLLPVLLSPSMSREDTSLPAV